VAEAIQRKVAVPLIIIKVVIWLLEVEQFGSDSRFQCLDLGTHALRPRAQLAWPELTNWSPGTHKGTEPEQSDAPPAEIHHIRVPAIDWPLRRR
jgi:hypothetical protein